MKKGQKNSRLKKRPTSNTRLTKAGERAEVVEADENWLCTGGDFRTLKWRYKK